MTLLGPNASKACVPFDPHSIGAGEGEDMGGERRQARRSEMPQICPAPPDHARSVLHPELLTISISQSSMPLLRCSWWLSIEVMGGKDVPPLGFRYPDGFPKFFPSRTDFSLLSSLMLLKLSMRVGVGRRTVADSFFAADIEKDVTPWRTGEEGEVVGGDCDCDCVRLAAAVLSRLPSPRFVDLREGPSPAPSPPEESFRVCVRDSNRLLELCVLLPVARRALAASKLSLRPDTSSEDVLPVDWSPSE